MSNPNTNPGINVNSPIPRNPQRRSVIPTTSQKTKTLEFLDELTRGNPLKIYLSHGLVRFRAIPIRFGLRGCALPFMNVVWRLDNRTDTINSIVLSSYRRLLNYDGLNHEWLCPESSKCPIDHNLLLKELFKSLSSDEVFLDHPEILSSDRE